MRPLRKPSANALFFVCVSALGVLLLANLVALDTARVSEAGPSIGAEQNANGTFVLMRFMPVAEGSVIRVQTFGIPPRYDLYVTEGGGADALRDGRQPSHVLHHSPGGSARPIVLDVVRPAPAEDATRPVHVDWSGNPIPAWRADAGASSIDVVLVDPTPVPQCPADEHCRRTADVLALQETRFTRGPRAVVLHASADDLQALFYGLEALAGLGALGSLGLLVAGSRRRRGERARVDGGSPPADSAEGLLDLVARAETYLATLRNALAGAGVLLLFVGLLGAVAFEEFAFYFEHLKPSVAWQVVTLGGMVAVYALLVFGWLAGLVAAQRELSRFRRRMAAAPALEP